MYVCQAIQSLYQYINIYVLCMFGSLLLICFFPFYVIFYVSFSRIVDLIQIKTFFFISHMLTFIGFLNPLRIILKWKREILLEWLSLFICFFFIYSCMVWQQQIIKRNATICYTFSWHFFHFFSFKDANLILTTHLSQLSLSRGKYTNILLGFYVFYANEHTHDDEEDGYGISIVNYYHYY